MFSYNFYAKIIGSCYQRPFLKSNIGNKEINMKYLEIKSNTSKMQLQRQMSFRMSKRAMFAYLIFNGIIKI